MILKRACAFFVVLVVSGCAIYFGGGYREDSVDPDRRDLSVAFGFIDMSGAPTGFDWVHVWRYQPNYEYLLNGRAKDGLFWHMGLEKGRHQLTAFGSKVGRFTNVQNEYHLGWEENNQTSVNIKKPGAYFMGAFRFERVKSTSSGKSNGFKLVPIKTVSERQALLKLIKIMESDYSRYENQIRLAQRRLNGQK